MQRNDRQMAVVSTRFKAGFPSKLLVTVLLSTALLAGCGHKAADSAKTQVVAKINGKEITIHEVNQYIAQSAQLDGTPEQIRQHAIDAVIDQNLLLQAAKQAQVDRDPNVLQSLLASNKNILINAYLARQSTQLPPPTDAQILAYYQAHPALFADRKLYHLDQINIQANEEQQTKLLTALRNSATVGNFITWLKIQRIPFDEIPTIKAQEDMNERERMPLLKIKVGDAAITNRDQDAIGITMLTATQPQPIALENARLKVSQMLTEAARQQKIADMVKAYRHQAKIEYIGQKD